MSYISVCTSTALRTSLAPTAFGSAPITPWSPLCSASSIPLRGLAAAPGSDLDGDRPEIGWSMNIAKFSLDNGACDRALDEDDVELSRSMN
ncbi:hypothetical protein K466DRAFT_391166 [Polyporus arcularius HHB13444]|uniref:Uncharacterized protein n=1 Tax=Polyporus arcularius HHB13444 TaxID=1314778 RepID=A0A5C3NRK3_9APHY|nr:hypothetical protein K466DRAFT_391166 [Polyporus arcularius HHB13444]